MSFMSPNFKRIVLLICVSNFYVSSAYAESETEGVNLDQRFLYFGIEGGIAEPVVKKFRHKNSGSDFVLKKSEMFGVKFGYSFYPQMAIGLSAAHQPKYRLHYTIPPQTLTSGDIIPETSGSTKVVSNVFMLNATYDLAQVKGITPFVIMAAGLAQVQVKPASLQWQVINADYFRIRKTNNNCFAWQIGLGLAKDLTTNFSINISGKLQTVHNIRIKYETLDFASQAFVPAIPIKKTVGVGEFAIGFTYKLPI